VTPQIPAKEAYRDLISLQRSPLLFVLQSVLQAVEHIVDKLAVLDTEELR
jgi:hypothetical protein